MSGKVCARSVVLIFSTSLFYLLLIAPEAFTKQSGTNSVQPSKNLFIPSAEGFHEDFKSLTLESSTLRPQTPVVLEKTDILDGKYVRERIQVGWRPKDAFDLYVTRPKDAKKPPVVLFLYSFPENAKRFQSEQWYGAGAAKDGYAVVGFVSAITAERVERRPPDETFLKLLPEALASSVHDVQMILNYLDSRGDLDVERVGMFATGSGATIAILASAADPRIKALDVFNPWGDWPVWTAKSWAIPEEERGDLTTNRYLDPKFLEVIAPLDPIRWVASVKAQSIRIQYVRSEATAPVETTRKIAEAAPERAEINEFNDYRVWMSVEHGPEMFGWLRQELQPDAKPKVLAGKSKQVHFFSGEAKTSEPAASRP